MNEFVFFLNMLKKRGLERNGYDRPCVNFYTSINVSGSIEMYDDALILQVLGLNNIKNFQKLWRLKVVCFSLKCPARKPGSLQAEIRYFEGLVKHVAVFFRHGDPKGDETMDPYFQVFCTLWKTELKKCVPYPENITIFGKHHF